MIRKTKDIKCKFEACPQHITTHAYRLDPIKDSKVRADNNCCLYSDNGARFFCRNGFPDGDVPDERLLIPARAFEILHGIKYPPTSAQRTAREK